jgi:hypothetical protein
VLRRAGLSVADTCADAESPLLSATLDEDVGVIVGADVL